MRKFILTIIVYAFAFFQLNAQDINENKHKDIILNVFEVLNKNNNFKIYPDSIAIYNYLIKLKIEKDENKKATVKEIVANDSTIFKVFPNYLNLKELNFDSLLINTEKLEYRIPILISSLKPAKSQLDLAKGGYLKINIRIFDVIRALKKAYNFQENSKMEDGIMVYQQPLYVTEIVSVY